MAKGTEASVDIGELVIDPDAEVQPGGKPNLAAQAEEDFYTASGVQFRL